MIRAEQINFVSARILFCPVRKYVYFRRKVQRMKRLYPLFIILICLLGSCQKSPKPAILEGEINGLAQDTLILYGNNKKAGFIDTIPVREGRFSHKTKVDTFTQAMLVFPSMKEYPVYLDSGQTITVKGDLDNFFFDIKGSKPNEDLTAFYTWISQPDSISTDSTPAQGSRIQRKAEEFIRKNQSSAASIYLLDKYFASTSPDSLNVSGIKDIISFMHGELRDMPTIKKIEKDIEQIEKAQLGKIAPSFSLRDSEGKRATRYEYRNKYLLINFWATWSDSCSHKNAELRKIYDTFIGNERKKKKKNRTKKEEDEEVFDMLGISIDADKSRWLKTIAADTLEWRQLRDSCEWESDIINQYSILSIPYTILIGTDGRILGRNLQGEQLEEKIKELTEREKERKKKEKEREKERARQRRRQNP